MTIADTIRKELDNGIPSAPLTICKLAIITAGSILRLKSIQKMRMSEKIRNNNNYKHNNNNSDNYLTSRRKCGFACFHKTENYYAINRGFRAQWAAAAY